MITYSESGLNSASYTALLGANEHATYQYVLHLDSFDWESIEQSAETELIDMDTCVVDDEVWRVWVDSSDQIKIDSISAVVGYSLEHTGEVIASGSNFGRRVTIVTDDPTGNDIRAFFIDSFDAIEYIESTDGGSTWGASTNIGTVTNAKHIAAASLTRVHIASWDGNNTRLHIYEYVTSWTLVSSNIYYTAQFESMDVIEEIAGARDLLFFVAPGPDRYNDYEDTAGDPYPTPMQGVWEMRITIHAADGGESYPRAHRYGYLRQVDVVDAQYEDDIYILSPGSGRHYHRLTERNAVQVSKIGDYFFITYQCWDNGTASVCYSRSMDGIHWEAAQPVGAIPMSWQYGGSMERITTTGTDETYVFLIAYQDVWMTRSTDTTGISETNWDITDDVMGISISQGPIRQLTLQLNNSDGGYNYLADPERLYRLVESLGYIVSGTVIRLQTAIYYIDRVMCSEEGGRRQIQINASCKIGQMRYRAIATDFEMQESQAAVLEDAYDLGRVVAESGNWDAQLESGNETIVLLTHDAYGRALLAGSDHIWCGTAHSALKLASGAASYENVGLGWHCNVADEDNKTSMMAYYQSSDDKIHVARWAGGSVTGLAESPGTLGWSEGTWYALRLDVQFARVTVSYALVSADEWFAWQGFDWVENFSYVDAAPSLTQFDGYFCMGARGYSDKESTGPRWASGVYVDHQPYQTLEEAIHWIAAHAGVHDITFEAQDLIFRNLGDPAYGSQPSAGVIRIDSGNAAQWNVAFSSHPSSEDSFAVSFKAGVEGAFAFYAGPDNAAGDPYDYYWNHFKVIRWRDGVVDLVLATQHNDTFTQTYLSASVSYDVHNGAEFLISVHHVDDTETSIVCVWIDDVLVLSHACSYGEPPNDIYKRYVGLGCYGTDQADYTDFRLAVFAQETAAVTLDPGETALQALSRILRNIDIEMKMRFDGSLWIGQQQHGEPHYHFDTKNIVTGLARGRDFHQLVTHVRQAGTWDIADRYAVDRMAYLGRFFSLEENGLLSTYALAQSEAERRLLTEHAASRIGRASMPHSPFMEANDRLDLLGEHWYVAAYRVSIAAGALVAQLDLQQYTRGTVFRANFLDGVAFMQAGMPALPGPGQLIAVVDTESNLTVIDEKMVFDGGTASPAWGDPGVWWGQHDWADNYDLTNYDGQMLFMEFRFTSADTDGTVDLGWDLDTSGGAGGPRARFDDDGMIHLDEGAMASYEVAVIYQLAIVIFDNQVGTAYFIKGGSYKYWTLFGMHWSANKTADHPCISNYDAHLDVFEVMIPDTRAWIPPLLADTFDRDDGSLGITDGVYDDPGPGASLGKALDRWKWAGNTWAVDTDEAANAPTGGSELVAEGGIEVFPQMAWSASGNVTVGNDTSPKHAGSYSLRVRCSTYPSSDWYAYQGIAAAVGSWVHLTGWGYRGSGSQWTIGLRDNGGTLCKSSAGTSASWVQKSCTARITAGGVQVRLWGEYTGVLQDHNFDDISAQVLVLSELFATVDPGIADIVIGGRLVSGTEPTQVGLVMNLDDADNPANFVLVYFDQYDDKLHLVKCVAGTYTEIASQSVTYSASSYLSVLKRGTEYYVNYGSAGSFVEIATAPHTISDAGIIDNTIHGLFSTGEDNRVREVIMMASGTENQYHYLDDIRGVEQWHRTL